MKGADFNDREPSVAKNQSLAERGGFEPPILFRSIPVFETSAFSHSAIFPEILGLQM